MNIYINNIEMEMRTVFESNYVRSGELFLGT